MDFQTALLSGVLAVAKHTKRLLTLVPLAIIAYAQPLLAQESPDDLPGTSLLFDRHWFLLHSALRRFIRYQHLERAPAARRGPR